MSGRHAAVARASIASTSHDSLTLSLKRAISPHLLRQGVSVAEAVGQQGAMWRIDRDDTATIFVHMRQNLLGGILLGTTTVAEPLSTLDCHVQFAMFLMPLCIVI